MRLIDAMSADRAELVAVARLLGAAVRRHVAQPLPTTAEELQARLEAAGAALMGLQVRGTRPAGLRSCMPDTAPDPGLAYGYDPEELQAPAPSNGEISDMDAALAWIALIPLDPGLPGSGEKWLRHGGAVLRRLVMARALVHPITGKHSFSWRRLGEKFHVSAETARTWHGRALGMILCRLHPPARNLRLLPATPRPLPATPAAPTMPARPPRQRQPILTLISGGLA